MIMGTGSSPRDVENCGEKDSQVFMLVTENSVEFESKEILITGKNDYTGFA